MQGRTSGRVSSAARYCGKLFTTPTRCVFGPKPYDHEKTSSFFISPDRLLGRSHQRPLQDYPPHPQRAVFATNTVANIRMVIKSEGAKRLAKFCAILAVVIEVLFVFILANNLNDTSVLIFWLAAPLAYWVAKQFVIGVAWVVEGFQKPKE